LVNNKIIAANDSIIEYSGASRVSKTFTLREFIGNRVIHYGDTIQIGIQTWIKDSQNNFIFDTDFPKCSQPIYIEYLLSPIDKLYLKVKENFKRILIYKR
jgi:hypothetical protein